MFTNNIAVVTINAVAKNLPRIRFDGYSSEYFLREETGEFWLKIRNSTYRQKATGKLIARHNAELIQVVYPTTAGDPPITRKTYVVFEDEQGDSLLAVGHAVAGLIGVMTSANVTKMLSMQS